LGALFSAVEDELLILRWILPIDGFS